MRVAVVGSRTLSPQNIQDYLPPETAELVSGGARGVDQAARACALRLDLPLTEFLPDYRRYGRAAPLKRNLQIVEYADYVLAFWDGVSTGTRHILDLCAAQKVPCRVVRLP